jgi:hypothetical protein
LGIRRHHESRGEDFGDHPLCCRFRCVTSAWICCLFLQMIRPDNRRF